MAANTTKKINPKMFKLYDFLVFTLSSTDTGRNRRTTCWRTGNKVLMFIPLNTVRHKHVQAKLRGTVDLETCQA